MKRILCFFTAMSVFAGSVMADEGMWMLPLLQKMNGKAMQELGCQLTPKQIYDINNSSLRMPSYSSEADVREKSYLPRDFS